MRARIDISEVEARTKIRAKYLRAIENEEWDLLPGPVYVKSFLRTYGDYSGSTAACWSTSTSAGTSAVRPGAAPDRGARARARARPPAGRCCRRGRSIGVVLAAVVVALYLRRLGVNKGKSQAAAGDCEPASHQATGAVPPPDHRPRRPPKPTTVKLQLVPTGTVYVCLVDGRGKKLIPARSSRRARRSRPRPRRSCC